MRNYEFLIKHGSKADRILAGIIAVFFILLLGVALGYAWAINAYGIEL